MKAKKKTNKKEVLTPMEKLTKGYEDFIKEKEVNSDGKELFDKALKKAVEPKQRSSK